MSWDYWDAIQHANARQAQDEDTATVPHPEHGRLCAKSHVAAREFFVGGATTKRGAIWPTAVGQKDPRNTT
ncbi:hypothetical protein Misp02_53480 [Microtetraspora sp. NBRC 16547]|nr:hypothetical protein Misp02_53480 [Microtetraspora sp. NBRC 16547]